jgi:hypothetical protein
LASKQLPSRIALILNIANKSFTMPSHDRESYSWLDRHRYLVQRMYLCSKMGKVNRSWPLLDEGRKLCIDRSLLQIKGL